MLRVTFRLAWVAANPVSLQAPTRTASYPASAVTQGTFVGALALDGQGGSSRPWPPRAQGALPGNGGTAEDEAGPRPDGHPRHRRAA